MKRLSVIIPFALAASMLTIAPTQAAVGYDMSCGGAVAPTVPSDPANLAPVLVADTMDLRQGDSVTVAPLSNDADPENDALTLVGLSCSTMNNAYADGIVVYYDAFTAGSEVLKVAVSDGQHYVTSTITLNVQQVLPAVATVIRKNGKSATVKFVNPNAFPIKVWAGSMKKPKPDVKIGIAAGQSVRVKTRLDTLDVLSLVKNNLGVLTPVGVDSVVIRKKRDSIDDFRRTVVGNRWVS